MLAEPKCFQRRCRHFLGAKYADPKLGEESEHLYCKAFPDGIPEEVAYGENKHKTPLKGQGNNVVFEQAEGE